MRGNHQAAAVAGREAGTDWQAAQATDPTAVAADLATQKLLGMLASQLTTQAASGSPPAAQQSTAGKGGRGKVRRLRHCFGSISHACHTFPSYFPSLTRLAACSTSCPCLSDADGCLRSDVVLNCRFRPGVVAGALVVAAAGGASVGLAARAYQQGQYRRALGCHRPRQAWMCCFRPYPYPRPCRSSQLGSSPRTRAWYGNFDSWPFFSLSGFLSFIPPHTRCVMYPAWCLCLLEAD